MTGYTSMTRTHAHISTNLWIFFVILSGFNLLCDPSPNQSHLLFFTCFTGYTFMARCHVGEQVGYINEC